MGQQEGGKKKKVEVESNSEADLLIGFSGL